MKSMNNEILVVDDDPIIRLIHLKVLNNFGLQHSILAFPHGEEALCHIQNCEIDRHFLVLLDINMPVMNGWEFLQECEHLDCPERISTIMVTSSINLQDHKKAMEIPVVKGFFEKPFNLKAVKRLTELEEISTFFPVTI